MDFEGKSPESLPLSRLHHFILWRHYFNNGCQPYKKQYLMQTSQ